MAADLFTVNNLTLNFGYSSYIKPFLQLTLVPPDLVYPYLVRVKKICGATVKMKEMDKACAASVLLPAIT